eukprot:12251593-Alexandrium_andersonii.AAC.1
MLPSSAHNTEPPVSAHTASGFSAHCLRLQRATQSPFGLPGSVARPLYSTRNAPIRGRFTARL